MNTQNAFSDTVRQMWDTRPPRIPSEQGGNAKVAGVCEGIGVRYQIDPTIVRILFTVSLFTLGGGIAAYLLAWMAMPRYGMSTAPVQAVINRKETLTPPEQKERSTGWWLIIFFFLLISSAGSTESTLASTGLLAILLLLVSWWLLHQRTPHPPAGLLADTPTHTMPSPVNLTGYTPAEGTDVPTGHVTPPSWDPLGAAPFAWDLPEPGPAPEQKPRKARIWPWVALGLVGTLGAVAMAFGVFGIVITKDDINRDLTFTPVAEGELQNRYKGEIGALEVDLRQLPTLDKPHEIVVDGGLGPINAYLPSTIPVDLRCEKGLGPMDCEPGLYNEGSPGGLITLTVEGGIGPVKVSVPQETGRR